MQEFWGLRLAALVVDAIFLTLFMWVLTALIYPLIALTNLYLFFNFWFIVWGLVILLYFTMMEAKWFTTLGKGLLKLKVESFEGDLSYKKALMRNLSKFLWIPLVVDVAIGFSRSAKGSRRRYLDDYAKTRVVKIE